MILLCELHLQQDRAGCELTLCADLAFSRLLVSFGAVQLFFFKLCFMYFLTD